MSKSACTNIVSEEKWIQEIIQPTGWIGNPGFESLNFMPPNLSFRKSLKRQNKTEKPFSHQDKEETKRNDNNRKCSLNITAYAMV